MHSEIVLCFGKLMACIHVAAPLESSWGFMSIRFNPVFMVLCKMFRVHVRKCMFTSEAMTLAD